MGIQKLRYLSTTAILHREYKISIESSKYNGTFKSSKTCFINIYLLSIHILHLRILQNI